MHQRSYKNIKKIILNKNSTGFSLAEALITLLIVCLIVLASIPILTKKKRNMLNLAHGAFACYWDGDKLVVKYYMNGEVSDASVVNDSAENRDGCIFTPPSQAGNFVVTIAGAGGASEVVRQALCLFNGKKTLRILVLLVRGHDFLL